jgi:hypothetical protein
MTDPRAALAEALVTAPLQQHEHRRIARPAVCEFCKVPLEPVDLAERGVLLVTVGGLQDAIQTVALHDPSRITSTDYAERIFAALSAEVTEPNDWRAAAYPDTIPGTCHSHRIYDCMVCHPRIAIEAASDEDKARAGLSAEVTE